MNTEFYQLPNYRQITITFMGPTNTLGARVKIQDKYQHDEVVLSYDYAIGSIAEQGMQYLLSKGFNPVCRCSTDTEDIILCNNWGSEFVELK